MPLYQFQAADGEVLSITMSTKLPIESYHVQVVDGKVYQRVYDPPRISIDSRPGTSADEFRRATTNKKNLTVGQMQDLSREMHEKRAEKEGVDEVKENYYKQHEKEIGKKHPKVIQRETLAARNSRAAKAKQKLKKYGVEVTL